MPFDKDRLAANIRAERARKHFSQEELAKKAGLSAAAILGYEQGLYAPGAGALYAIAEALHVTPNDLLGWT